MTQLTTTLYLNYQPPLAWRPLRDFLGRRAMTGIEAVEGNVYCRTVRRCKNGQWYRGWLEVVPAHDRDALQVTLQTSLEPVQADIMVCLRRQFDLDCQPQHIAAQLGGLAQAMPGLRVPGAFDGLETAVRTVLGQQVTVKAASTLAGRVVAELGEPLATPYAALTHTSPTAEMVRMVAPDRLGKLGIVGRRIQAIQALADDFAEGRMAALAHVPPADALKQLKRLPGVGDWTAQYFAMRILGWADAFPAADYGILKALGVDKPRQARECAEPWRPVRAYAVMYLWQQLAS